MRLTRRTLIVPLAVAAVAAAGASIPHLASAGASSAVPIAAASYRPVLFVHGAAGSAEQFGTQAKRLASNGYPAASIDGFEYDSLKALGNTSTIQSNLDAKINKLLAATGADKVDLVGHSLGTFISQGYLNSSRTRAAKVAHYVNLDGSTGFSQPGRVPTLAIWGEGSTSRRIWGATNVYQSNQSHTQTVSSVETFQQIFKFFRGQSPATTTIAAESNPTVSGRAVLFPSNEGVGSGTIEVYPVDQSGKRTSSTPQHKVTVGSGGAFGPLAVDGTSRYEFSLVRSGIPTHHFYYRPAVRSDSFIRLLAGNPGEGLGANIETSDRHTALTLHRQKEFWGDQGSGSDRVTINGTSILNSANAPRSKRVIGVFAFDKGSDGVTNLSSPIDAFFDTTFMTGMDVFIPATGSGTVSISIAQRGGSTESYNVPDWKSSAHRVTVSVSDH